MPRVTIPGIGDVNFPDNMPRDEIMSRAEAMQKEATTPKFDPKDLSFCCSLVTCCSSCTSLPYLSSDAFA